MSYLEGFCSHPDCKKEAPALSQKLKNDTVYEVISCKEHSAWATDVLKEALEDGK